MTRGACFPNPFVHPRPLASCHPLVRDSLKDVIRLPGHLATAFATLLGFLLCGEESATHAFGDSLVRTSTDVERAALTAMANDEAVHACLIDQWLARLPDAPSDLDLVASRRFFKRLQSRDRALHFARIAALDASVCRLLSQLIRSSTLAPCRGLVSGLARIRSDEARHVRVSRTLALRHGMRREALSDVAADIDVQLALLMAPAEPAMRLLTGSTFRSSHRACGATVAA
jgi:hypothetical protein